MTVTCYLAQSLPDLHEDDWDAYDGHGASSDMPIWMFYTILAVSILVPLMLWRTAAKKNEKGDGEGCVGFAFGMFIFLMVTANFAYGIGIKGILILLGIVITVRLIVKALKKIKNRRAVRPVKKLSDPPQIPQKNENLEFNYSDATIPAASQPCNIFITPAVTSVGEASTSLELFAPKFRDLLWDDCSGIFLCGIEAGDYVMGSPPNERGHRENENIAKVVISEGFWMARTPCTQSQWEAVMGTNPSRFTNPEHPVEQITWEEASEFCVVLTRIQHETGQLPLKAKWSLPSEAQWEYACRAGHRSSLNNGTAIKSERNDCRNLDKVAWFRNNSGGTTHPVGEKVPNAWGLYDMHGNVWEWCRDWYIDRNPGGQDPCNLAIGQYHAIRGGGWGDLPWACRSAARHQNPLPKDSDFGFRPIISW
ncbi:MAG: Serine/threonine-protein kinase pkn1 [Verrucomicrobiota bacterium]|jgi:formylglycine-generating enzyme required for sulfatase activity